MPSQTRSRCRRVIGRRCVAEAGDRQYSIERQSGLGRRPRFVEAAEKSQRCREPEMCDRLIAVVLDGAVKPCRCRLIGAQLQLGDSGPRHPEHRRSCRAARGREAERGGDMGLHLFAPTDAYPIDDFADGQSCFGVVVDLRARDDMHVASRAGQVKGRDRKGFGLLPNGRERKIY